jgi:hypothetical protein
MMKFVLFSLLLSFAFADIDPILNEMEKCQPNLRFGFVNYILGRIFSSDEIYYDIVSLLESNPTRLIGVRNR